MKQPLLPVLRGEPPPKEFGLPEGAWVAYNGSEKIVSIDQPRVVDFCGVREADGCFVLTISDHREWNDWEHLLALQEKLNNYLAFIESGEIYAARPEARGLAIEISICCRFAPEGEDDFSFLRLARNAIESAGFRFSVIGDTGVIPVGNSLRCS